MNTSRRGTSERSQSIRKTRDRAFILPLVGLVFLMPPVASIFQLDVLVLGIPFTASYLFIVWAILIGCAAFLYNRLQETNQREDESVPMNETGR